MKRSTRVIICLVAILVLAAAVFLCAYLLGRKFAPASNGLSVSGAHFDENGHLILEYSDGSQSDAGAGFNKEQEATYTVVFQDWDGTILRLISHVPKGDGVEAPVPPARKDYEFIGWDNDYSSIENDTIVRAQYKSVKKYSDVYGIVSNLDEESHKLKLTFRFSQSPTDPVPIMSFQLRVMYDNHFNYLSSENGKDVTSYAHQEDNYISVVYFNYSGEVVGSSFDFITVEFDVSNCVSGDKVTLDIRYVLDADGLDMADRVFFDSAYIYEG